MEWDASSLTDTISNKLSCEEINNISDTIAEREENGMTQNIWPIVDLSKLDLNLINNRGENALLSCPTDEESGERGKRQMENNNLIFLDNYLTDKMRKKDQKDGSNGQERTSKFQKTKRSSKNLRRSLVVGKNNVIWPGILLNYTNNFEVASNFPKDQKK